jgi:hypothetical protein
MTRRELIRATITERPAKVSYQAQSVCCSLANSTQDQPKTRLPLLCSGLYSISWSSWLASCRFVVRCAVVHDEDKPPFVFLLVFVERASSIFGEVFELNGAAVNDPDFLDANPVNGFMNT